MFKRVSIQVVSSGNLTQTRAEIFAQNFMANFESIFKPEVMPEDERLNLKCLLLPTKKGESKIIYSHLNANKAEKNSAFLRFQQIGYNCPISRPSLSILATIMKPNYFNELRTKQNVGYIVTLGVEKVKGINYLTYKVQSATSDPFEIKLKTEEFLTKFIEKFEGEELKQEFMNAVEGLKAAYNTPYRNTNQVLNLLVSQISQKQYEYDVRNNAQKELSELTFEQFLDWSKSILQEDTQKFVEVHLVSQYHSEDYSTKLKEEKSRQESSEGRSILFMDENNLAGEKLNNLIYASQE